MALPYSAVKRVFNAAVLTATSTADGFFQPAAAVQLLIVNTGFTGTLDIQGSLTYDGTYVNLPYAIMAVGPVATAVAQLSYTTNTANHHIVVLAPMPFMKFVMTRSAGSITMDARVFSNAFHLPLVTTAA
jgi:hypothetical protein